MLLQLLTRGLHHQHRLVASKSSKETNRAHLGRCVTFKSYPYDEAPTLDDQDKLDYVLVRGLQTQNAVCAEDMPQCYEHEGKSYGPTDHFPLVVDLKHL